MIDYFSKNLSQKNNQRKKHLCTLQNTCEDNLINFITQQANNLTHHEFVFLTRDTIHERFKKIENNYSNIRFITGVSFYEIVGDYDTHISIYSTCIVEAPSFGIKSIVLELFDLGKSVTDKFPRNHCFAFVDNASDFIQALEENYDTQKVLEDAVVFCNPNFEKNVIDELKNAEKDLS